MKKIFTCSVLLAGYFFGAAMLLCGAVLYLPYAVVSGSIKMARDKIATKKFKAATPLPHTPPR